MAINNWDFYSPERKLKLVSVQYYFFAQSSLKERILIFIWKASFTTFCFGIKFLFWNETMKKKNH